MSEEYDEEKKTQHDQRTNDEKGDKEYVAVAISACKTIVHKRNMHKYTNTDIKTHVRKGAKKNINTHREEEKNRQRARATKKRVTVRRQQPKESNFSISNIFVRAL